MATMMAANNCYAVTSLQLQPQSPSPCLRRVPEGMVVTIFGKVITLAGFTAFASNHAANTFTDMQIYVNYHL
jgi:hypothetical protein